MKNHTVPEEVCTKFLTVRDIVYNTSLGSGVSYIQIVH